MSFTDWSQAQNAPWTLLDLADSLGYHGAPQVFYHRGQALWYLVFQLEDAARGISFGPCYSTTKDIANPAKGGSIFG